ncbi:MAG: hypothetical protein V7697_03710, partial [Rhodococcus erythropolis]
GRNQIARASIRPRAIQIVEGRLMRERAKFADYDDLKSQASKLAEIEEAKKTETEKLAERIAATEAREAAAIAKAEAAELKALKSDVARDKGVPVGSLTGVTKEELEAAADELVKWRDSIVPAPKKHLKSGYVRESAGLNPRERAVAMVRGGVA